VIMLTTILVMLLMGNITSDCSLSSSSEVAQEQRDDPSLTGC